MRTRAPFLRIQSEQLVFTFWINQMRNQMKSSNRSIETLVDRLGDAAEALEKASRRSSRSARNLVDDASSEAENILAREWRALKSDLSDLASHTDLESMPEVKAAVERMRTTFSEIGDRLEESAETVRRRTSESLHQVNGYAHESPWKTAGLATLAGVAIGLMISRR